MLPDELSLNVMFVCVVGFDGAKLKSLEIGTLRVARLEAADVSVSNSLKLPSTPL